MSSKPHLVRTCLLLAVCLAAAHAPTEEPRASEPPMEVLANLSYRDGSPACRLDLAVPKDGRSGRPAIVVIHGGGWIEGDKSSFSTADHPMPGSIREFARRGFVAATINYRLSREATYPAGLEDCRLAVRWLRAHAAEYGIDPKRIGAYGNSAGGHLALLLALMPEGKPPAAEPHADQSSRVQAAASDSGPVNLLWQHERNQLRGVIETFLGGAPQEQRYREASPSSYVGQEAPPLLLIYGEADGQVGIESVDAFMADLSRAGHKNITYLRLAGVDHCPHSLVRVPFVEPLVQDFFARALKLDQKPAP
ncbi:MAG TPA: alpha/beta hydrolase [Pirellulales bacterium]|jgi:acetyl esterase/lipase|nr:alpha/beta hydrolase [Pirellulales bacterium]